MHGIFFLSFFSFCVCLVCPIWNVSGPFLGVCLSLDFPSTSSILFLTSLPFGKTKKCYSPNSPEEFLGLGLATSVVVDQLLALTHTHTHTLGTENVSTTKETKTKTTGWPFFFLGNCCALDLREKRMNDLITFGYAPIEEKKMKKKKPSLRVMASLVNVTTGGRPHQEDHLP